MLPRAASGVLPAHHGCGAKFDECAGLLLGQALANGLEKLVENGIRFVHADMITE